MNDYYPGGMMMPGRKYSIANTNYRYGFNGKENDNEVKGEGNQQDYGERIYDPRIGKFLSVDPLLSEYPMLTPYQFASNRPIDGVDQDGLEWKPVTGADGNVTDYTWSGFNADGSAIAGTTSGGTVVKGNATYNFTSISVGDFRNGGLSISDGSNVQMNATIWGTGSADYSFDELDESGRTLNVFESGHLGNANNVSGGQIAGALNSKYNEYVYNSTVPMPSSGAVDTDGLGLFDWFGPSDLKALAVGLGGAVIKKEVANVIANRVVKKFETVTSRRAEFRAVKRSLGISMSEHPNVIKVGTAQGDKLLPRALKKGESRRVYDFKNGKRIREDLPKRYKGGKGSQDQHFNFGNQNDKLRGHSKEFKHKP